MQALKATEAREINKADITEAETLVFEGRVLSQTGKQTMQPGEFYYRTTFVPVWLKPSWIKRLFGAEPEMTLQGVDTIVIACPYCSTPLMTTSGHTVEHRSPLTISREISCPYAPDAPHSFKVVDGTIIAA
ncbi:MAG TPA: hypothetical protein VKR52_04590 [Terracidiphilus sp.]|nr:hypothetical protein [Terracidiphilus sp.]